MCFRACAASGILLATFIFNIYKRVIYFTFLDVFAFTVLGKNGEFCTVGL